MCMVLILAVIHQSPPPTPPPATQREEQLEDEYLLHYEGSEYVTSSLHKGGYICRFMLLNFVADSLVQREWTIIRDWWFGEDLEEIQKFCVEFHEVSGRGQLNVSALIVHLGINFLRFRGKNCREFARIDVLIYAENTTKVTPNEVLYSRTENSYITSGLNSDCIYYLKPTDPTDMEFYLDAHVCKK